MQNTNEPVDKCDVPHCDCESDEVLILEGKEYRLCNGHAKMLDIFAAYMREQIQTPQR